MKNLAGGSRYLYEARVVQLTPADLAGPDHPSVQWANRVHPVPAGTWQLTGNRLAIHQDGQADIRFIVPVKSAVGLSRLLEPEVPFHSITLKLEELLSEHVIRRRRGPPQSHPRLFPQPNKYLVSELLSTLATPVTYASWSPPVVE